MKKLVSVFLTFGMLLSMTAPMFAEETVIPAADSTVSVPAQPAGSEVSAPTLPAQDTSAQMGALIQAGEAVDAASDSDAGIENAADVPEGETLITDVADDAGTLIGDAELQSGTVDLSGEWLAIDSAAAATNIQNAPAKATYYIPGSAYNTQENTVLSIDGMRVYTDVTLKDIKLVNGEVANGVVLRLHSGIAPYQELGGYSVFSNNGGNSTFKDKRNFLTDENSIAQVGINFTKLPDGVYQIWLQHASFKSETSFSRQTPAASYRVTKSGTDLYFDRPQAYYYDENGLQFISTRVAMKEALSMSEYNKAEYDAVKQAARDITKNCANDVEKVKAVHDWLADNIAYDYEGMNSGNEAIYNAAQTFSRKRGVCSGVARLANAMLRTVEVPSVSIQGRLSSGGKTNSFEKANEDFSQKSESFYNHEWNAVYVNGGWQYIDATADMGKKWHGEGDSKNVNAPGAKTYYMQGLDAFALSHVALRVGVYNNPENEIKPSTPGTGASVVQTKAFVTRLYKNVMEREPDETGRNNWVNSLMSGKNTAADVVANFFLSTEFTARKLTNEQRVTIAYKTMLNREPEAAGAAAWVDALNRGASMRFLAFGFVDSPEFTALCKEYGITRGAIKLEEARDKNLNVTGFVQRLYQTCLGRYSDVDGLNGWCNMLLTKTKTAKEVAHYFVFSEEFKNKKYNNTDYLKQLYLAFMGRQYDQAGLDAWNAAMTKGMTREEVLSHFADSKEFAAIRAGFGV
ncbi:MAG: DUF4214 domain-containing protein [Ruthenibacterium sp.]